MTEAGVQPVPRTRVRDNVNMTSTFILFLHPKNSGSFSKLERFYSTELSAGTFVFILSQINPRYTW